MEREKLSRTKMLWGRRRQARTSILSTTLSTLECGQTGEVVPSERSLVQRTTKETEAVRVEDVPKEFIASSLAGPDRINIQVEGTVPSEVPSSDSRQVGRVQEKKKVFPVSGRYSVPYQTLQTFPSTSRTKDFSRDQRLQQTVQRLIDEVSRGQLPDFMEIGDNDVEEAFEQHVYLKQGGDQVTQLAVTTLFSNEKWTTPTCVAAWNSWEPWRRLRENVWQRSGDAYKKHQMACSFGGFLHSMLKNLFPGKLDDDPTYDYGILMEVVRAGGLEYAEEETLTIINYGDCNNRIGLVMSDVARGKPVLVKSVLAKDINMMDGEDAFQLPENNYIMSNDVMDEFLLSYLADIRVNIIYAKVDNGAEQGLIKDFNQHRIIYSLLCLAVKALRTGGSLVINCTHLGLEGFFISNMYLLCQLFSEVSLKKPVAGVDSSMEVIIISKGFRGRRNPGLVSSIVRGNETNIKMEFHDAMHPLGEMQIPAEFVQRAEKAGEARFSWMLKTNQRNLVLFPKNHHQNVKLMLMRYKIKTVYFWLDGVCVEDYVFGIPSEMDFNAEDILE